MLSIQKNIRADKGPVGLTDLGVSLPWWPTAKKVKVDHCAKVGSQQRFIIFFIKAMVNILSISVWFTESTCYIYIEKMLIANQNLQVPANKFV